MVDLERSAVAAQHLTLIPRRQILGMMTATGALIALRPRIAMASTGTRHQHLYSAVDSTTHGGPVALVREDSATVIRKLVISGDGKAGELGAVIRQIGKDGYYPISLSIVDGDVGSTAGSSGRLTAVDHGESTVPLNLSGDELEEPDGPFSIDTGNNDFLEYPSHSDDDGDFDFDGWPGCALAKVVSRHGTVAVILHPAYADGDHFDHISVVVDGARNTLNAAGPVVSAAIQPPRGRQVRVAVEVVDGHLELWERSAVSDSFQKLDQLSGVIRGSAAFAANGQMYALTSDSRGGVDAHILSGTRWVVRRGVASRKSSNFAALPIQGGSHGRWITSAFNIIEVEG